MLNTLGREKQSTVTQTDSQHSTEKFPNMSYDIFNMAGNAFPTVIYQCLKATGTNYLDTVCYGQSSTIAFQYTVGTLHG